MTDDEIETIAEEFYENYRIAAGCANLFARAIIAAHEAKLREVPEAVYMGCDGSGDIFAFDEDQLLAYGDARALAARDAVIEECAVECEGMYNYAGEEVAMCIRALKRGEA